MKKQNVPFEEVYDLFAVRIIIDAEIDNEKSACWNVYSIVTDYYKPNPDRLRDWISTPKTNGYESLHTTVMGPDGHWVEVQIRSERMDQIAEKGLAAHWIYKKNTKTEKKPDNLNKWIKKIDYRGDSFLLLESLPARETRAYIKSVTMNIWMYRLKQESNLSQLRTLVHGNIRNGDVAFLRPNVISN